jgi:ribosomal protein S18 acetylase RimI-like enzyme
MYTIREYTQKDLNDCAVCLYEGFFNCPVDAKDLEFLHDYAQVLIEKCHFTFVAEYDGIVVGFISGFYQKRFNKKLSKQIHHKKNYNIWIKMVFKYYMKLYHMSNVFKHEYNLFFKKLQERPNKGLGKNFDCELVVLTSRKNYRKGLGTALINEMMKICKEDNVKNVRLFTNTAASYKFYEKYGFKKIYEKEYEFDETKGKSLIYEYCLY